MYQLYEYIYPLYIYIYPSWTFLWLKWLNPVVYDLCFNKAVISGGKKKKACGSPIREGCEHKRQTLKYGNAHLHIILSYSKAHIASITKISFHLWESPQITPFLSSYLSIPVTIIYSIYYCMGLPTDLPNPLCLSTVHQLIFVIRVIFLSVQILYHSPT